MNSKNNAYEIEGKSLKSQLMPMKENKLKTKISTAALMIFIFFYPIISNAGWFSGPENYDECMLEKMKGQDKSMRGHAMRACRKLFPIEPVEKEIFWIEWSKIKTAWRQNGSTIEITIEENLSNYNISKIVATFSTQKCGKEDLEFTLTEDFIFRDENPSRLKKIFSSENEEWKTTSFVQISDNQKYECMREKTIWGYPKK